MKTLKTSLVLLSSIFVLAACGQKATNGSATETTQAAQATTTAPTTQVASNKQAATDALPKDGEATYKHEEKGRTHESKWIANLPSLRANSFYSSRILHKSSSIL